MKSNLDYMNKTEVMEAIEAASNYILSEIDAKPEIALILGSGLGAFAEKLENPIIINYTDIPHFPHPTVEGHSGKLFVGKISGKCIAVMQGRNHFYEGYTTQTITFPIRVFANLGIEKIILTNACGGINENFSPGELMIIEDHIAFLCPPALRGAHLDKFGPRFTDMSKAYYPEYVQLAQKTAAELNIKAQKGVYAFWPGPTYETAAEIRAFMALGADVVGMSTVPECQVAVNAGMKVLGISCITNMTCVISKGETNHEEVIEMGKKVAGDFMRLLNEIIKKI